jgi:hypothetical protein
LQKTAAVSRLATNPLVAVEAGREETRPTEEIEALRRGDADRAGSGAEEMLSKGSECIE